MTNVAVRVAAKRQREATEAAASTRRGVRIQILREAILGLRKECHGGYGITWAHAQERAIAAVAEMEAQETATP
jgi:hypothetical protein